MRKWTKELIITELQCISKELKHSPSVSELPPYLYGASYNYFGSFNKAKEVAGLEINKIKYNPLKKSAYISSNEFAYVLGVVYGDGSCNLQENKRGSSGNISLAVRDKDFALRFKEVIEEWSGLKAKYELDKRDFHKVALYSVDACRIIENFDLNNILKWERKSQFEFLKGLFDSDGGIVGINLDNRRKAKRWLHFSNNNLKLINLVRSLFDRFGMKYSVTKRIHSGFGSKKLQYEIKIYNLKDIYFYYSRIGFSIGRKQDKLKEVVDSYDYYSRSLFDKAKQLHRLMGFRRVAKELNLNPGIIYGWLFKNNQKQILDFNGGD